MIVHEWGHLRWGVFDEYATTLETAYRSSLGGKTKATACSVDLANKGMVEDVSGNDCSASNLHHTCQYHPPIHPSARGSIMFKQYIESVNTFCDDGSDKSTKHNPEAPNNQNRICQHRSTWDVITSHEDFKDEKNPPRDKDLRTKPTFRVVRAGSKKDKVVLVLDLSNSLVAENRIDSLRQSARLFIAGVGDGTAVSLVTFQGVAARRLGLRTIKSRSDRKTLMRMLPTEDELEGKTSIGAGILEALRVLTGKGINETINENNITPVGGTIVLITDGEETEEPYINSVVPLLSIAKTMVYPVGISQYASKQLARLAELNTGMNFHVDSNEQSYVKGLSEAMMTVTDMMPHSSGYRLVQLHTSSVTVNSSGYVDGSVMLDADVGMKTTFMFMWQKKKKTIHVRLVSPSGKVINHTSSGYRVDKSFATIEMTLPDKAENGTWRYRIFNPDKGSQTITLSVTSRQGQDTPIIVRGRVSRMAVTFPEPIIISAEVMKGYMVVMGASVEATVSRPQAAPMTVTLLDNGVAPDITAGDGMYTAYFTGYTGNGLYNVVIKVTSGLGNAEMMPMTPADDFAALSDNEMERSGMTRSQSPQEAVQVAEFSRMRSAGAFELKGFVEDKDMMAPARVMDLRVVGSSLSSSTVTLEWVAPGDDAYSGRAQRYSLRISTDFYELLHRFDESVELYHPSVTKGSLMPANGGTQQQLTIKVPIDSVSRPYFGALQAYDEAGNPSGISNIVSLEAKDTTSGAMAMSAALLMSLLLSLLLTLL
jgi:Mg-chelatase subunit ChlD